MSVTIEDIAKELKLSVSTVSKALNGYSDVAVTTRQRILTTAETLGYHPNMAARSLRRRRTEKIGVVVNYPINVVDDFLSELIPGAAQAAEEADYNLILYTSVAHHPERISKICRTREVDGFLLLWPPQLEQTVALMAEEETPYVVLPRRVTAPHVPYIAADHTAGGRLLTQHLLNLGHRRIGFTTRPELYESSADRLVGYQAALADAGLAFDGTLVLETTTRDPNHGAKALQTFLTMREPPTAILAFTDPMAMQMLAAANELGIRVPEDLSITGHDGILTAGMTVPTLTTIRQPIPEMGRLAVETLLAQIGNSSLAGGTSNEPTKQPLQRILPVELVVRNSTAAPA